MTTPINALVASTQREPVSVAAPATRNMAPAKKAAVPDGAEKAAQSTSNKKIEAFDEINATLKMSSIGVRFEFDKEADMMIAKVVDVESGDVIRQMPTEEAVHISKVLGKLQGLLVSQKV
jgi:flagellar protein FlaG